MKRTFVLTMAGLALLQGLASAAPVKITLFAHRQDEAVKALATSFNKEHSDIRVDVLLGATGDGDYPEKLMTSLAAGIKIDVFRWNTLVPSIYRSGVWEDLAPYIKASKVDYWSRWQFGKDAVYVDGKIPIMPFNMWTFVTYYNKDVLNKAGVGVPGNDWTWGDLRFLAQKIAGLSQDRKRVAGFGIMPWPTCRYMYAVQKGFDFMSNNMDPIREQMRLFTAMRNQDNSSTFMSGGKDDFWPSDNFGKGQMGFMLANDGCLAYRWDFMKKKDLQWDILTVPHPDGVPAYTTIGEIEYGLGMSRLSRNRQAAWRFIEFCTSGKGQRIMAAQRQIPAYKYDGWEGNFFAKDTPPYNREPLTKARVVTMKANANNTDFHTAWQSAFNDALANKISVEDGIKRFIADRERIVKKNAARTRK